MPAIGRRHARDRHIGVADGLELFQPVPGDDLVECGEILIKQADQRARFGALGEQRETLEIGEQDRRSRMVFWLDLPAALKFVGDRRRQEIGEQFLSPRLLGRGGGVRLIQLRDHAVIFEEAATQFELRDHLIREPAHRFRLLEFELPRLKVHHTKRAERIAFLSDERHAAIEGDVRVAGHERIGVEAAIIAQVGHS